MGEGIPQKVSLHNLFTANVYDGGCKRLRERMQTFAVKRGSALQGRMQCTAGTVAVHCGSGCSALRERLQCTASEMGKTGTEIASPILDKRTGRRDAPVAPWKYLLCRDFYVIYIYKVLICRTGLVHSPTISFPLSKQNYTCLISVLSNIATFVRCSNKIIHSL